MSAEDAQTLRIYAETVGAPYPAKPEVEHVLALAARLQEAERERDEWKQWSTRQGANRRAYAAEAREAALREALAKVHSQSNDANIRRIAAAALTADPESEEAPG